MQLSLWFCFVGLLLLVIVCALFQRRPRPNAFSYDELNQIRIDRELAKEVKYVHIVGRWRYYCLHL